MLSTIFSPSIENSNVKACVMHMLSKMNYEKYRNLLCRVTENPDSTYKFVVFEYTYSPTDAPILQAEYVPGTRALIHNVIQNPDFAVNMRRLFGNYVTWYTRRKTDNTKPYNEQVTNIRQLVLVVADNVPPLIPSPVLNPEDDMPGLIPLAPVLNPEDENVPLPVTFTNYYNMLGLNRTVSAAEVQSISQGGWGY
jgi:hypothetical protein